MALRVLLHHSSHKPRFAVALDGVCGDYLGSRPTWWVSWVVGTQKDANAAIVPMERRRLLTLMDLNLVIDITSYSCLNSTHFQNFCQISKRRNSGKFVSLVTRLFPGQKWPTNTPCNHDTIPGRYSTAEDLMAPGWCRKMSNIVDSRHVSLLIILDTYAYRFFACRTLAVRICWRR